MTELRLTPYGDLAIPVWPAAQKLFQWDGSLRDIVALDCHLSDWASVVDVLAHAPGVELELPQPEGAIWADPTTLFTRFQGGVIVAVCGGLKLKSDLISVETMEFNLDPRDVRTADDFQDLLRFMRLIAVTVGRPVSLNEEGNSSDSLFRVIPADGAIP